MINITIYDPISGRILRNVNCLEEHATIQVQDGEAVVDGLYPPNQFYWDGEFKPIPKKPEGLYNFDYTSKSWIRNTVQVIAENRLKRNAFLAKTDWTQLNDVALSTEIKLLWATYRQALRDMTEQDFLDGNFPIYQQISVK